MTTMTKFMEGLPLTRVYAGIGILTLIFQIWVRSYQCAGFEDCGLSFVKAIVWSVIWPLSWIVYLV